jgi:hypothetical protein
LPIALASCSFNKAERNYSTVEKELASIVWGIKHFRPYLYGRKFKVVSDHKHLTWIMSIRTRFKVLEMAYPAREICYEVVYEPRVQNSNVDVQSRIRALETERGSSITPRTAQTEFCTVVKPFGITVKKVVKMSRNSNFRWMFGVCGQMPQASK